MLYNKGDLFPIKTSIANALDDAIRAIGVAGSRGCSNEVVDYSKAVLNLTKALKEVYIINQLSGGIVSDG